MWQICVCVCNTCPICTLLSSVRTCLLSILKYNIAPRRLSESAPVAIRIYQVHQPLLTRRETSRGLVIFWRRIVRSNYRCCKTLVGYLTTPEILHEAGPKILHLLVKSPLCYNEVLPIGRECVGTRGQQRFSIVNFTKICRFCYPHFIRFSPIQRLSALSSLTDRRTNGRHGSGPSSFHPFVRWRVTWSMGLFLGVSWCLSMSPR